MKKRNIVLVLLTALGVITFLDRINISVAQSDIMRDLQITNDEFGWVHGSFILSYGLLQIPLGLWGDKKGQRIVLVFVVLWWSLFTIFTGLAWGLVSLIIIRFMFGIGEAGAYPCMTGAIGRWFPKSETGRAQGYIWAASRVGGALTPIVVIPVIGILGWRMAFYILGTLGFVWVIVWYFWYRDNPATIKNITAKELDEITTASAIKEKVVVPWRSILRNNQFWIILSMYWSYAWASWFLFSWFPRFMEIGRGFSKEELKYVIAIPYVMSMIGNITGGYLSDWFSKTFGLKIGRRLLGVSGLAVSSVLMFLAGYIPGKMQVFIFLSLCFGIIDLMLPSAWAICVDIGKKYSGAISGAMNMAGNIGGFVCALIFGYIVEATNNYNLPLLIISGMLVISAVLFSRIDASKPLVNEE